MKGRQRKDSDKTTTSVAVAAAEGAAAKKTKHVGPVHALIRVRSEDGRTIKAHEEMIRVKGVAVLGKIGQGLGPDFITALNKQIERGIDTYLFLTTREGWNGPYVSYQCKLKAVEKELHKAKRPFVPKYYESDYENVSTWFEITSMYKMSRTEMNQIFVISSGREIMSVIKSTAAIFRVGLKK